MRMKTPTKIIARPIANRSILRFSSLHELTRSGGMPETTTSRIRISGRMKITL